MRRRVPAALTTLGFGSALAFGCGHRAPPAASPDARLTSHVPPVTTGARITNRSLRDVGLDADTLDRSVDPCHDFYQFACGNWLAKTEIPSDESRWSRSFNVIAERNRAELRGILEAARTDTATTDRGRAKLGAFYGACMDEPAIEAAGLKAIKPLIDQARAVHDAKSLALALAAFHKREIWAVFSLTDVQDANDATRVIAAVSQAGLGLPDRDYYVKDDPKSKEIRAAYLAHVTRMFRLSQLPQAEAARAAADVMNVETELAKVSKTRVERRDPQGTHNKIDRVGLVKAAPGFPWDDYFKGIGFPDIQDINAPSVQYIEGFGRLITAVKPAAWRNYLAWHVLHETADVLTKPFVDEAFAMEAVLTGQKTQSERWKRCVAMTDELLGDELAKPFVEARFGGTSRDAARAMVLAITDTFGRRLDELDWMDAATRAKAKAKIEKMTYLIGYPSKWRTYDFEVSPKAFTADALAAREADTYFHFSKIGKPVDREEWEMTPPKVNAYNDAQRNEMVFPAGILQPPFYDPRASVAVNAGAIGMVVGHELTHGFDDSGSQYNGDGNLVNWWSPDVNERFHAKTACVANQYSAYEPLPGVRLNGALTLGENIADMGGVKLAFRAYRQMRAGAATVDVAEGFNEDQQFFLAVGEAWCAKTSDERARMAAQVDPHSPARFRVNGSLSDLPEFAKAFSCAEGTPMHPKNACEVW